MSDLEDELFSLIKKAKLPTPLREFRFHEKRKWRVDFAFPDWRIAIEVEGGTWAHGRHNRGAGFEKDCEKYNELALAGFYLYRFTSSMIHSGLAVQTIQRAFE